MYKSSSQTNLQKYLIPFFFLTGLSVAFTVGSLTEGFDDFQAAFLLAFSWSGIFIIQSLFRLRNIEVNNDEIVIKSFKKQKVVPYKDVISVSKFDLASPQYITLKYFEPSSGSDKKICYIPSGKDKRLLDDDAMTGFIKNKAEIHNPNYIESSTSKNLAILMLMGLPIFLLMLYFINQNLQLF